MHIVKASGGGCLRIVDLGEWWGFVNAIYE